MKMPLLASRKPNPSHFPSCRAAGAGPSLVCSHLPSFFSLPDLTCGDQEITEMDGEQIALARSSLFKESQQESNYAASKSCQGTGAAGRESRAVTVCSLAILGGQRGGEGTSEIPRAWPTGESKWKGDSHLLPTLVPVFKENEATRPLLKAEWAATGCSDHGASSQGGEGALPPR